MSKNQKNIEGEVLSFKNYKNFWEATENVRNEVYTL